MKYKITVLTFVLLLLSSIVSFRVLAQNSVHLHWMPPKYNCGIGNNKLEPKATSTREQATIVAVRVYETYAGLTK